MLTAETVAAHAHAAGFRGEALVTIVAIAFPESGLDPASVGDIGIAGQPTADGRTWGPSIGLWQIRSIREESGTGRSRDATRLADPAFNARSAYEISGGGTNFGPWSAYVNGAHRAHLDEARTAARVVGDRSPGGSVPPLASPAPSEITGEVAPPGGGLVDFDPPAGVIPTFNLEGTDLERRASNLMATGGRIDLSVHQVSKVTVDVADPNGPLPTWSEFKTLAEARVYELDLVIVANEWGEDQGADRLTVTMHSRGVERMRRYDPSGRSRMWDDSSPTEVLAERARACGLRFYGKGTARRPQIVRHGRDDAGREVAESDWELAQRLAREEGFWCFESAGALWFAPPTWVLDRGIHFPARWRASSRELLWETLGHPTARRSVDMALPTGRFTETLNLTLPRWRGEQVRCGMAVDFAGIPGFNGSYLVTAVGWDLDGGIGPVSVEAVEAVDPVPEPPTEPGAPPSGTGDDATATEGSVGLGPATPRGGPYGYQYDPVGSTCSGGPQPGAVVLMAHLLASFPGATNMGIYNCRPVAGTDTLSVHAEGRAGDTGARGTLGAAIADWLVANAPLIGIQQVIWDRRDWNSRRRTWDGYGGANPHTDHVHWELSRAAAAGLTETQLRGATSGGIARRV